MRLISEVTTTLKLPNPSVKTDGGTEGGCLVHDTVTLGRPRLYPQFGDIHDLRRLRATISRVNIPNILGPMNTSKDGSVVGVFSGRSLCSTCRRMIGRAHVSHSPMCGCFPSRCVCRRLVSNSRVSVRKFMSAFSGGVVVTNVASGFMASGGSARCGRFRPSRGGPRCLEMCQRRVAGTVQTLNVSRYSFRTRYGIGKPRLGIVRVTTHPNKRFVASRLMPLTSNVSFIRRGVGGTLKLPVSARVRFTR